MRPRFPSLLLALALFPSAAVADEIRVAPKGFENPGIITDLDSLFADLPAGTTVRFDPGDYMLTPKPYLEETCGNCEAESTRVEATYGLRVTGRGLFLIGPDSTQGEAVIHTNAGYGVLIEDCRNCNLEGLTITGGVRDTSGLATDAGIVVKRSSANIVNCTVRDNIGDPAVVSRTVVGIIGIMVAVGIPAIATYIKNYRIRGAAAQVAGEFQTARARAIKRNASLGVVLLVVSPTTYRYVIEDDMTPPATAARSGRRPRRDGPLW